jgi:hypothetical protein
MSALQEVVSGVAASVGPDCHRQRLLVRDRARLETIKLTS